MTPVERFMQAVIQHKDAKPMIVGENLHTMLYGVIVELKVVDDCTVSLEKILSNIEQGKGRASLALAVICDLADICGVTIVGRIRRFGEGLSNEQLARWYARSNFDVLGHCITRVPQHFSTQRAGKDIMNRATETAEKNSQKTQSGAPTKSDFFQDLYGDSGVRPPLGRGISREQAATLGVKTEE